MSSCRGSAAGLARERGVVKRGRLDTFQLRKVRMLSRKGSSCRSLASRVRETLRRPADHRETWTPQNMFGRYAIVVKAENATDSELLHAPTEAARSTGRILLSCALGLPRGVGLLRIFLLVLLVGPRLVVLVVCGVLRLGIGTGVDLDERRIRGGLCGHPS